ncbi:MAG TPA: hypothetical protein VFO52_12985 [Longimicrobiales bacterium]|nr:hypothetical protein [Longimicrobiales bacterium]
MIRRLGAAALLLLVMACSDSEPVAPPEQAGVLTENLTFFRFSADAYLAAEKQGSFWAVRGQARQLVLRYTDTYQPFLEFTVGASSIVDQDSVLITVQVDEGGLLTFHFQPSGLRFNPLAPALLRIDHGRRNPDIDADGDVDLNDSVLALQAGIWKRELPILPWLKLPSLSLLGTVEEARVYDFTSFGMAVD